MNRHLRTWAQHWQRGRRNRRALRELDAFSPAERRIVADDVGLSGTDLRRFNCTHEGPTELMPARLRQLGIDPAYVKVARTASCRELERVCATCRSAQRCASDLAKGDAQTGMQSYCLNGPTIDCLIVDRPERAHR
jgi:uncharacterized protein YjiS (DUF1127 family)